LGDGGVYAECLEEGELKIVVDQVGELCTQVFLIASVENKQREMLQVVVVGEEEVAEGLGGGLEGCLEVEFEEEGLYVGEADWEIRLGEGIEERGEVKRK